MSRGETGATVLFRVCAGPRTGFGHLVRALALAEALGVEPRISLRAGQRVRAAARRLGAVVVRDGAPREVLARQAPSVLLIDDRVAGETAAWRRAARAAGIRIVSVHDLGIGLGDADLVIDGSIRQLTPVPGPARLGPAYAILRPAMRRLRRQSPRLTPRRILVALGGGPRAALAARLARQIAARHPALVVGVAGGFLGGARGCRIEGVEGVAPPAFDAALASADLIVTAGGVTLFEACSLGVPAVAVAVVPSQRPTVADVAARGAAIDAGLLSGRPAPAACARVVEAVSELLADPAGRLRLARNGRRLVDGRGAERVAAEIRRLASGGRG